MAALFTLLTLSFSSLVSALRSTSVGTSGFSQVAEAIEERAMSVDAARWSLVCDLVIDDMRYAEDCVDETKALAEKYDNAELWSDYDRQVRNFNAQYDGAALYATMVTRFEARV